MTNIVNYCKNPSYEVNVTDDWTPDLGGGARAIDATQYKVGANSCKLTPVAALCSIYSTAGVAVPNGSPATASVWVRCAADPTPDKFVLMLAATDWSTTAHVHPTSASNGAWEYITVSLTNNTGVAKTFMVGLQNNFGAATAVWVDACQLELASAASAYTDGAQGEGHSWAGAAHNSVSTWTEPASVGFVTVIPYMMV